MFPFAPGRFSTTTCCPRRGESRAATARATRSLAPPAEKPTRRRMGLVGYASAAFASHAHEETAAAIAMHENILTPPTCFQDRNPESMADVTRLNERQHGAQPSRSHFTSDR